MQISDLQKRVHAWMRACFGSDIAFDTVERNARFIEEAVELVQACGYPKATVLQVVEHVYAREAGQPAEEVGDGLIALAALCTARGIDMETSAIRALSKIELNIDRIREKRQLKPLWLRSDLLPQPERVDAAT